MNFSFVHLYILTPLPGSFHHVLLAINMAEDAEQSSESLSTSEEFEIVGGCETNLKADEKLSKKVSDSSKSSHNLFPMV